MHLASLLMHLLFFCFFLLFFLFYFVCTVMDFSAVEKARGLKFCMRVGLLSGQVFSPFGELGMHGVMGAAFFVAVGIDMHDQEPHRDYSWHTGAGAEPRLPASSTYHLSAPAERFRGHLELGASVLRKAVWWDLSLASLLTHLLPFILHK